MVSASQIWTSANVPSDITVDVSGVTFALHKSLLISRCGLLKMLVGEERKGSPLRIELEGVPGGSSGFELAAKFCYGVCPEISPFNVALLRCLAEFLDMSDEHGEGNLMSQTDIYLENLQNKTLTDIVTILRTSETLLPLAEDLQIVNRCIQCAASKAIKGTHSENEHNNPSIFHKVEAYLIDSIDWCLEDLSLLCISFYQRVMQTIRRMGLTNKGMSRALVFYAQQSLNGFANNKGPLCVYGSAVATDYDKRILVESIVGLLPREKDTVPIHFLIGLLRISCLLDTTLACRLDLEGRITIQLHTATLDDILIPSFDGETSFDVDIVHRIVSTFLEEYNNGHNITSGLDDGGIGGGNDPMLKVAKLLDHYLAIVAVDEKLNLSKFIALAEILPAYARPVEDALYRAIDAFLKAHSRLTDVEKKKLCGLLDFQRLTQDACTHAAQNERLPVQAVVQVLYFEQLRIRNAMGSSYHRDELDKFKDSNHSEGRVLHNGGNGSLCASLSPERGHCASVRKENQELKLEVSRMRMRLSDLEKEHDHMKNGMQKGHPPLPYHHHHQQHGFFHALSKSMGKLNPFHHHKLNQRSHHKLQPPHYEELLCYQGGVCKSLNHSFFDLSESKV